MNERLYRQTSRLFHVVFNNFKVHHQMRCEYLVLVSFREIFGGYIRVNKMRLNGLKRAVASWGNE